MIDSLSPDFADTPGRRLQQPSYQLGSKAGKAAEVSIITPYYNTEALFLETFVSLQAQSLQNWEWVIVDDGSTDPQSMARLAEVASKDLRIKVFRQPNAGPGSARNKAVKHSVGRYLFLLDSDDMVEPTYLEKCVWFLDSNPEFAFCNSYSVVFGDEEYLWTTGFERGKLHLKANSGPPISVIRRDAFLDSGGFDESIRFGHEDWDFWLAMAKAGHWGHTIPEYLQWYRKRGNGRFEQIMRTGDANRNFEKLIHEKYAGLEKKFPAPTRRPLIPFETLMATSRVNNHLAPNPGGRRIMFIVPWMVAGGADRVNLDLIEGLSKKGHDISVCATLTADHTWEHQFCRFASDVFVLPNFLHASDYPRFLSYLIESRSIDTVVVTGSTIGYQLLPYLRSVSPGVAFVDMCHVEELHWLNGGHPRFAIGYQELLDLNVVTTRHLAQWMLGRGADESRIKVMHTGVRAAHESQLAGTRDRVRAELKIPANLPVVVFAGRICEQKRPALLAEILKRVSDTGLQFKALIVGDGDQRALLESMLSQYHLTVQVQMLGSASHQRWLDLLVASDVLLMPSQYEGISIALLEAMAAGVVPVVANVGGQEEIVSPDVGVLIAHGPNELQQYADAVHHLLSDSSHLKQMANQCKAMAARQFSWQGMIDAFEGIMDEAHRLRVRQPRHPISPGFGYEMASLALEYKRLGDTVDWMWRAQPLSSSVSAAMVASPAEAQAIAKFAVLLSQSRLGRLVFGSRFLRSLAKRLYHRMTRLGVS